MAQFTGKTHGFTVNFVLVISGIGLEKLTGTHQSSFLCTSELFGDLLFFIFLFSILGFFSVSYSFSSGVLQTI